MALQMKKAAESTTKAIGGFREIVQDALVPELREIKAQIAALKDELRLRTEHLAQQDDNLREELRLRDTSLREELRLRDGALRDEIKAHAEESKRRDASMREELKNSADRFAREIQVLSDKLDHALDIRERIIALEARLPRTQ